jgi:hypothetical protein
MNLNSLTALVPTVDITPEELRSFPRALSSAAEARFVRELFFKKIPARVNRHQKLI